MEEDHSTPTPNSPDPPEPGGEAIPDLKSPTEGTARPKTEFERKLGMASMMVQIGTLTFGAVFALWKFGLEDRPTLEDHLRVTGAVRWERPIGSSCVADLDIDVENKSKSDITVGQVRGAAWLIDPPKSNQQSVRYFDPRENLENATPMGAFEYKDGPLVQRYVPGQASHNTFEWILEPQKDKFVIFRVQVFRKPGDSDEIDRQDQWDIVCGEKPSETEKKVSQ